MFLFIFLSITNLFAQEKVYIIDTGKDSSSIFCKESYNPGNYSTVEDRSFHGVPVSKLAVKDTDYCVVMLKWCDKACHGETTQEENAYLSTLKILILLNAKYINISMSGSQYSSKEKYLLEELLNKGAIITVSSGNKGRDLSNNCNVYPACYFDHPNYKVVGSLDKNNKIAPYSNYGKIVKYWENGDYEDKYGTSFAAPRILNKIIKGEIK